MNYSETYHRTDICPSCNSKLDIDVFTLCNKKMKKKLRDMVYNLDDISSEDRLVYCIHCNKTYTLDYILGFWAGHKEAMGLLS